MRTATTIATHGKVRVRAFNLNSIKREGIRGVVNNPDAFVILRHDSELADRTCNKFLVEDF